jgi:hypothetical protein
MNRVRPFRGVLAIAAVTAGCMTAQPDVGEYASTATSSAPAQAFRLPRDRKILLAFVPGQPACAVDLVLQHLQSLGVSVELPRDQLGLAVLSQHQNRLSPLPESAPAGLDDALVLAVLVGALEGPGGGWRPVEVMDLKSAHRRSDIGLAIYEGRLRSIVWASQIREQRVLDCEDPELLSMIRTIAARIE